MDAFVPEEAKGADKPVEERVTALRGFSDHCQRATVLEASKCAVMASLIL